MNSSLVESQALDQKSNEILDCIKDIFKTSMQHNDSMIQQNKEMIELMKVLVQKEVKISITNPHTDTQRNDNAYTEFDHRE